LSFVGRVHPYKNLVALIGAFRELDDQDIHLLIAGKPVSAQYAQELRTAAGDDPRIRLFLQYIPDDELQLYLRAANVCVIPFQEILNSSSALLSLGFGVPTACPNRGGLQELSDTVGGDWLHCYAGDLTAAQLKMIVAWSWQSRGEAPDLRSITWPAVAQKTVVAYMAAVDSQAQTAQRV
jgi:glycosyltransferase involved in cell wall biosynthesis